jgi:hypothetical protein
MSALTNLVTLTPVDPLGPGLRFHLDGSSVPGGGIGGWEVIPRPRRRGVAEWVGVEPWTLALPLYTDGHDVRPGVNHSVESKVAALVQLGYKVPGGFQPPVLEVAGPVRVPRPGMRWVLTSIEWGEEERRSDRQRIYQTMTVNLLEYVTAEILLGPAAQVRARS